MKRVLGQYYYALHRYNLWGVWQWDTVTENGGSANFIKDFDTKEEARTFVYEMNGWGKPKNK